MGTLYLHNKINTDGSERPAHNNELEVHVPTENEAQLEKLQTILDTMHLRAMKEDVSKHMQVTNGKHEMSEEAQLEQLSYIHNSIVEASQNQIPDVQAYLAAEYTEMAQHEQGFAVAYAEMQQELEELEAYSYAGQATELQQDDYDLAVNPEMQDAFNRAEDDGLSL